MGGYFWARLPATTKSLTLTRIEVKTEFRDKVAIHVSGGYRVETVLPIPPQENMTNFQL